MSSNDISEISKQKCLSIEESDRIKIFIIKSLEKYFKEINNKDELNNSIIVLDQNYNLKSKIIDIINNIKNNPFITFKNEFFKFDSNKIGNGICNLYPLDKNKQIFTFIPNGLETDTHLFAVGHFSEQFFSYLGSNENNSNYWSEYAFRNESTDDTISSEDKNKLLGFYQKVLKEKII